MMTQDLFPLAGRSFEVDYGHLVATNRYAPDRNEISYAITSGPLTGNAATVSFAWRSLAGGAYAISWQEADGSTVVHVDDFTAGGSLAFFTTADGEFFRMEGALRSLS